MNSIYINRLLKIMKISYVSKLIACAMSMMSALCILPCSAQKKQHGKASFYSKKSTGARTASGQRLHHDSLTCAHRYYPFGTKLKVTNLSNNKSVIVKVIDRGPFGKGRIIDLSWAAAKEIGMIVQGVASVKIETVETPIPYRPEETKLPHVEFDVAESDYEFKPTWNHNKEHENNKKEAKPKETKQTLSSKESHSSKEVTASKEVASSKEAHSSKEIHSSKEVHSSKETHSSKEASTSKKLTNRKDKRL